jgi:hypothetical protein
MSKSKGIKILAVVVVIIGLAMGSFYVFAAEQSKGSKAVGKELEKNIGLPVLTGELWQKMTEDSKIAFIWGMWHTISIEHYLMTKYPDLKKDNFSAKVIEATNKKPLTINQTVAMIDTYYKDNPDHLDKPVVGVIWAMEVKPNLTVGIDGRPLNPKN